MTVKTQDTKTAGFDIYSLLDIDKDVRIYYLNDNCYKWTFEAKKVRKIVEYKAKGRVLNLFAGKTRLNINEVRVDISKEFEPDYNIPAEDYLQFAQETGLKFDTIIYDPPWNERKSKEFYKGSKGRKIGKFTRLKDDIVNILKGNGIIISAGYQITNFGKKRNTKLEEVFVVDPRGEIGIYFIAIERKTVSSLLEHFSGRIKTTCNMLVPMAGRKRKRGRRKNPKEGLMMGRGLHKETRDLIDYINEHILKGKARHVRRIYYALEARQVIESSSKNYQKVKTAIKMARFHGLIHPSQILLDKGRTSRSWMKYTTSARELIQNLHYTAYSYYINFWDFSDNYIEVWQEKESLEPDFLEICDKYNVRCETGRGDQSISAIYQAMRRWNLLLSADKKIIVLYFGDFNPSGLHAKTAIQNTIAKLTKAWNKEFTQDFTDIEFKRMALQPEHIEEYNLPENPTKKSTHKDKVIAKKFIAKYGDRNVELESLAEHQPDIFKKIIVDVIEEYYDEELKTKAEKRANVVQPRIEQVIQTMKRNYFEDWKPDIHKQNQQEI